jgi:hypothetical protein
MLSKTQLDTLIFAHFVNGNPRGKRADWDSGCQGGLVSCEQEDGGYLVTLEIIKPVRVDPYRTWEFSVSGDGKVMGFTFEGRWYDGFEYEGIVLE